MDYSLSEAYIAACIQAKRTTSFLPDPPAGLQRRHIFILKTCYNLARQQQAVCISDIATTIGSTLPSITKNIATLEKKGYVKKVASPDDKRVIHVELTEKGLETYQENVAAFHQINQQLLDVLPAEDIQLTIETINKIYDLMVQQYEQLKGSEETACTKP